MKEIFKKSSFAALTIVLTPILGIYILMPGFNIATVLLLICICIFWGRNGNYYIRNQWLYLVALMIIGVISYCLNSEEYWYSSSVFIHNLLPIFVCFFSLFFVVPNVNKKLFHRCWVYMGVIVSIITLFQRIQLIVFGSFTHISLFPFLQQASELDVDYLRRPTSLFLEPAHISVYLLPLFCYMLYEKKGLLAIIVGLGILFSGSTTGMLVMGVIICMYFFSNKQSLLRQVLFVVGIVFVLYFVNKYASDVIVGNMEKLEGAEESSARIGGGLLVIDKMDENQLVFGLGLNQMAGFMGIEFNNYANSILYSIISYGYVGLVCLLIYLYSSFKQVKAKYGYLIIFVAILCSDQILFNRHFIYLAALVILEQSDTLCSDCSVTSQKI